MKNRYGNEYYFELVSPTTYTIKGDLSYWRYGGKPNQAELDFNDLGFVDPSGGPFIAVGSTIEGKSVNRIWVKDSQIFFDV